MSSLPSNWVEVELSALIPHDGIFIDGDWIESKDQDPDGEIRLIQLADIGDGHFRDRSARFLTREKAHDLNCTFLKQGDILVARMPDPLGRACIFPLHGDEKYVTVVDVCVIRVSESSVSNVFLGHLINSGTIRHQIAQLEAGTTRKRISRKNLATVRFPLPPLAEQRRIVAKIEELFSELDQGIAALKQARAQLAVYRQALLKHAFEGKLTAPWRKAHATELETPAQLLARIQADRDACFQKQMSDWEDAFSVWEKAGKADKRPSKPRKPEAPEKPSSEHLSRLWELPDSWQWFQIGSFAFVTKLAGFEYTDYVKYDESGDLQVIKAENAGPNGYRPTNYSRIHFTSVANLTRSHLNGGELLVVFVGAGTGQVATVPHGARFFLGPNIGMARAETDAVNTRYVELFLRSPRGRDMILASVKAVAQPSLSMGTIRQAPVALPSPSEQAEIVRQIEEQTTAIDRTEADIETNLGKAEALRQAILKKAFAGELVPQSPADEPASQLLARLRTERVSGNSARYRQLKEAL